MQDAQPSLLARDDTFFGVCQGLGEDLGFNPIYLRLALTGLLFLNPVAAIGVYAAAGMFVAALRWLVPNPRPSAVARPAAEPARVEANDEADAVRLAA